jgi:hypothetical protein
MVRRDGTEQITAQAAEVAVPCCTVLAGESPALVSAGAPGSRLPCRAEETPPTKRSVESLEGGSNETGRNPLNAVQASSIFQPKGDWECRAGHVAAKATHSTRSSPARVLGLPGVLASARLDRTMRNTRGPSRRPTSGKDRPYKARAENERSRAGVRGAHGTCEGGDKPLEERGPALVAPVKQVSARACP